LILVSSVGITDLQVLDYKGNGGEGGIRCPLIPNVLFLQLLLLLTDDAPACYHKHFHRLSSWILHYFWENK